MPLGLLAIVDALLVIHYSTHAVLIVGGLAWLATALGFEPDRGGSAPAALIAILLFSIAWQTARLFVVALTRRGRARVPRPLWTRGFPPPGTVRNVARRNAAGGKENRKAGRTV